ncbi:MAG TPA: hypothetical protein VIQ31_38550 [Phormidium sp.]
MTFGEILSEGVRGEMQSNLSPGQQGQNSTTKVSDLIDPMLRKLSEQKKVRQFSILANKDSKLKRDLGASTSSKEDIPQWLVELGTQRGYNFTVRDIQNIPGTWEANSEKDVINAFLAYGKSGLEEFFKTAKRKPELVAELNKLTFPDKHFAQALVDLGEKRGYLFTVAEVNDVLDEIKLQTESNGNSGEVTYPRIGRIWA